MSNKTYTWILQCSHWSISDVATLMFDIFQNNICRLQQEKGEGEGDMRYSTTFLVIFINFPQGARNVTTYIPRKVSRNKKREGHEAYHFPV